MNNLSRTRIYKKEDYRLDVSNCYGKYKKLRKEIRYEIKVA